MIRNLKRRENDRGTYYTFTLLLDWYGRTIPAHGWRYWPDSKRLEGPRCKVFGQWREVHALSDEAREDIAEAARLAIQPVEIEMGLIEPTPELRAAFEHDPAKFLLEHPEWYRRLYIEASPPELQEQFAALEEGRKWPDWWCQEIAEALEHKNMAPALMDFMLRRRVITAEDLGKVIEFLGGRNDGG